MVVLVDIHISSLYTIRQQNNGQRYKTLVLQVSLHGKQEVQESDKGLIDSKTVAEVSDKAMETSLKLNGVEDGKRSYGRMVDLLLDWYFMQQEGAE